MEQYNIKHIISWHAYRRINIIQADFDHSQPKNITINVSENDEITNIALGKSVYASSYNTDENRYASYLVDGDSSTRWAQQQGTAGQTSTIDLDLEAFYNITKTSIDFELDSCRIQL